MLEDEESKKIFASRIRALITGNIGYIKLSRFPEYYHPQVRLQGACNENFVNLH